VSPLVDGAEAGLLGGAWICMLASFLLLPLIWCQRSVQGTVLVP